MAEAEILKFNNGTFEIADKKARSQLNNIANEMKNLTISGLTSSQINALDEMFKVCAYTKDVSTEYNAFKTAFGIGGNSGGGETPVEKTKYAITNNLTKVTTSNTATEIEEGSIYRTNLTLDVNCAIESVVITMGGVDITSTCFTDNAIVINEVTGDIIITVVAKTTKVTAEDLGFTTLYEYDDVYDKDEVIANENIDDNGILNYNYTNAVTIAYYVKTLDKSDVGRFDIFDARRFGWAIRAADGVASDNVTALGGLYKGRNYSNSAVSKVAGYTQGTGSQGKICLFTNSYNGGITEDTNANMHVRILIIQGTDITAEQLCTIFGI